MAGFGHNAVPSRLRRVVQSYQQHAAVNPWHPVPVGVQQALAKTQPSTSAPVGVGAPASPAKPPAPPTAQPLPFDPVYEQTVSNNQQRLTNTLGGLDFQRGQVLTDAGYTQDAAGNLQLDPTNPFSKAALLQRHYDQSKAASTNGLAAQGQLYSGALQNALNEDRFQFDQGTNANIGALQNALNDIAQRRAGAISDAQDANTAALGTSIVNAQNQADANFLPNAQTRANAAQATPKPGYSHINLDPSSPHFGQSYNVKGNVHIYANGTRVTVK